MKKITITITEQTGGMTVDQTVSEYVDPDQAAETVAAKMLKRLGQDPPKSAASASQAASSSFGWWHLTFPDEEGLA